MNARVIAHDVQRMFGSIAHGYDSANTVLSGGMHLWWQYRLLRRVPRLKQGCALDLCTGTGALVPGLLRKVARVWGADFCLPMLEVGRSRLSGAARDTLLQGDALRLPFSDRAFDVVTVAYGIRNLERLSDGLREIARVLKPGGTLLVLEFGQPRQPLFRKFFDLYSRYVMPRVGAFITGNGAAYRYLPTTSAAFPCRDDLCRIVRGCGFSACRYASLTGGIAFLYEAHREG